MSVSSAAQGTSTNSPVTTSVANSSNVGPEIIENTNEPTSHVAVPFDSVPSKQSEPFAVSHLKVRDPTSRIGPKIEVNEPIEISQIREDTTPEKQDVPHVHYQHRKRSSKLRRRGPVFSTCMRAKPSISAVDENDDPKEWKMLPVGPVEPLDTILFNIIKSVSDPADTTLPLAKPSIEKSGGWDPWDDQKGSDDTFKDLSENIKNIELTPSQNHQDTNGQQSNKNQWKSHYNEPLRPWSISFIKCDGMYRHPSQG